MIYYYDNNTVENLVIEDTFADLDRMFNSQEVYLAESFEDTILGKIISAIFNVIKWIFEKIGELIKAIGGIFSKDSFNKKIASIDPRTVERGTRVLEYYDNKKIEADFRSKLSMLDKTVAFYKNTFGQAINSNNIEKLKSLSSDIDLNDFATDNPEGMYIGNLQNPHFSEMYEKIDKKQEPYLLKKTFDHNTIQEMIKLAKNNELDPCKVLGVQPVKYDVAKSITERIKRYTEEIDKYSKKIETNKANAKDEDKALYTKLEKITLALLAQIKDCSKVITQLATKCGEVAIKDNFFKNGFKSTSNSYEIKDESTMLESISNFLDEPYSLLEEVINEAYIGKTKTLLEIEKQIGVVRQRALKKFTDINKSPEVLQLNRLFEKQFGMDCFCLSVVQESTINAYTKIVQGRFDIAFKKNISKYVEGDSTKGFKWKKNNGLCIDVFIYLGVIQDETFTDAEILAIILHEIGHNFADAIYDDIKYDNLYAMYLEGLILIYRCIFLTVLKLLHVFNPNYRGPLNQYLDDLNSHHMRYGKKKYRNPLKGFFSGLMGTKEDIKNFISEVFNRITFPAKYEAIKLMIDNDKQRETIKKNLGRQNEVIADKFAALYGYGPELFTALEKLSLAKSDAKLFMESSSWLSKYSEAFDIAVLDINNYDVHPHNIQRAMEELKLLEKELNKEDCDPKMKKMILDQVNEIKDAMNDTMKIRKNSTEYEKQRAIYYKLVHDQYPDAITDELEDAIEDAFEKVINGGK